MGFLGLVELALCLGLARLFGLYGLYLGLLAAIAITVAFMGTRQPLHGSFRIDKSALRALAVTSLVMMGYGLTNVALHNADRMAILLTRGAGAELGAYHLALTVSLAVNYVPYIILTVQIPRMFRKGGG